MPRHPRDTPVDTVQHIISRFVNREIRLRTDAERQALLRRIPRALERTDWSPLAYVLMGNHTHWAARAGQAPLRSFVHSLHSGFARWLNTEQGRLGPLVAGRPTNLTCDEENLARLLAYIHNNPVRAGVVTDPADSNWSSHRAYIGDRPPPPWLDVERGLALCGYSSSPSGRAAFHDYVRSQAGAPRDRALSGDALADARTAVRACLQAPIEVTATIGDRVTYGVLARHGTPLHPRRQRAPEVVARQAARALRVQLVDVRGRSRYRELVDARRLALIVWRDLGGTQAEMAAFLGLGEAAASRLAGRSRAVALLRPVADELGGGLGRTRSRNVARSREKKVKK
jgi:REP element-mobilizing transposase RayT